MTELPNEKDTQQPSPFSGHRLSALYAVFKIGTKTKKMFSGSLIQSIKKNFLPSSLFKACCNICGSKFMKPFADFGEPPRPNARCYTCSSLERHRAIWKFLLEETGMLQKPIRLLHIAPEPCIRKRFEDNQLVEYHPGDLHPDVYGNDIEKIDATDIPYEEGVFDLVICNHILEHIPDDRAAIRELYRVLKPGGLALILIPINGHAKPKEFDLYRTYEDPRLTSESERTKAFGQRDHVRVYGLDYKDRVEAVGFQYRTFRYIDRLPEKNCRRLGIEKGCDLQYAIKPDLTLQQTAQQ